SSSGEGCWAANTAGATRRSVTPRITSRTDNPRPWEPTTANFSTAISAAIRRGERRAPARRGGFQHVVGEKPLPVHRHHHDLHLVGQALRDDLLDEQRVVLQHLGF